MLNTAPIIKIFEDFFCGLLPAGYIKKIGGLQFLVLDRRRLFYTNGKEFTILDLDDLDETLEWTSSN